MADFNHVSAMLEMKHKIAVLIFITDSFHGSKFTFSYRLNIYSIFNIM